jgi:hypothetical protein
LALSHIPVVGSGFCLLLFVIGIVLRSNRVQRIGLLFIVITAASALWAYWSGDDAAAVLEASGVTSELIAQHRESAVTSLVVVGATGLLALAGLALKGPRQPQANWFTLLVPVLLVITLALMIGTAGIGMRITRPWLNKPPMDDSLEQAADSLRVDSVDSHSVADTAAAEPDVIE